VSLTIPGNWGSATIFVEVKLRGQFRPQLQKGFNIARIYRARGWPNENDKPGVTAVGASDWSNRSGLLRSHLASDHGGLTSD